MAFKKMDTQALPPRQWALVGFPATGKAQPLDALIKVPGGWKSMRKIALYDKVCAPDGDPSMVTGVFPQGVQRVYKITFADGRTARATKDHLWQVHYRYWKTPRVLATSDIVRLMENPTYTDRLYVPLVTGEMGKKTNLPIDPYILGVLLGDGSLSDGDASFTKPDEELAAHVEKRLETGYKLSHMPDHFRYNIVQTSGARQQGIKGVTPNEYMEQLKVLGLSGKRSYEKFIPIIYRHASLEQRMDLLRGLLDTDGTVGKNKAISFSTTSSWLAHDVQELVWSIGGMCHIGTREPSYTHNGEKRQGRTAYILHIRCATPGDLFSLTRKKERALPTQYSDHLKLRVVSVESDGEEECQCIRVSHPSELYITDNYVVTHNSTFATQMTGPLLVVNSDHRFAEVARLAPNGVYELSDKPADNINAERIAQLLRENMADSDVKTVVIDSLTSILSPLVVEAIMDNDAGRNKNRVSAFKEKALTMRLLQDTITGWGCDTLWIYHLRTGLDGQAKEKESTTITTVELARLRRSLNMQIGLTVNNGKRGATVIWARRGRSGMTLWDDTGCWKGMPEKIEQAVYGGLTVEDMERMEAETPKSFPNPAAAIAWGFEQGCFNDAVHAQNAYDEIKREQQPKTAGEMWQLWIADVERRKLEANQEPVAA